MSEPLTSNEHTWQQRAERICNLVLRLNADEGLSPAALSGLQRMAKAALGEAAVEPSATQRLLGAAQSRVQHYEAALRKIIAGRDSLAQSNIAHDALYSDSPSEPPSAIPFSVRWAMNQLLQDLPSNRDWLNPDVEKIFREHEWKAETKEPVPSNGCGCEGACAKRMGHEVQGECAADEYERSVETTGDPNG